jgi:hypothetical protein
MFLKVFTNVPSDSGNWVWSGKGVSGVERSADEVMAAQHNRDFFSVGNLLWSLWSSLRLDKLLAIVVE